MAVETPNFTWKARRAGTPTLLSCERGGIDMNSHVKGRQGLCVIADAATTEGTQKVTILRIQPCTSLDPLPTNDDHQRQARMGRALSYWSRSMRDSKDKVHVARL